MWWICTILGCCELGDGLGLGEEAGCRLGAGMAAAQDHLQSARTVQADLPGLVDHAHAAAAQLAQDLVAGDGRGGPFSRSRRIGLQLEKQGSIGFGSDEIPVGRGQLLRGLQIVREDASRKIGGIGRRFARGRKELVFRIDDRLIEEAVGLVASPQERLDPPPQFRIARALTIQDGGTSRGVVAFDGRQEHGLNTLRVEWHRMVLRKQDAISGGRTTW